MSENGTSLSVLQRADVMLAQATTIAEAKEVKDLALTAKDWARRKGLGQEAIDHARHYALLAERRMGEMLLATERAQGKRTDLVPKGNEVDSPTLTDIGITRKESARAQRIATIPETDFKDVLSKEKPLPVALREHRNNGADKTAQPIPKGLFRVVYADPPWKYGDTQAIDKGGTGESYGPADAHYPPMTIQQLCDLPVLSMVTDNAVLFLWVTSPLLESAFQVIRAWGFKYKTSFVWDKIKHNMGHYNSVRHEFLLVCTRGSCVPDVRKLYDSVQSVERTTHSTKPETFRDIIDTIYPNGARVELFARKQTKGWKTWGNEA